MAAAVVRYPNHADVFIALNRMKTRHKGRNCWCGHINRYDFDEVRYCYSSIGASIGAVRLKRAIYSRA